MFLELKELQQLTNFDNTIGPTALLPLRKSTQSIIEKDLERLGAENPDWRKPEWIFVKGKEDFMDTLG
jgi:hypothetical protein